jgi:hypothetical protein
MPDATRARLRNDSGAVPLWVIAVGFLARALLLAGFVLPILLAIAWIFSVSNKP